MEQCSLISSSKALVVKPDQWSSIDQVNIINEKTPTRHLEALPAHNQTNSKFFNVTLKNQ